MEDTLTKTPLQEVYQGLAAKHPEWAAIGYDKFSNDMKDESNLRQVYDGLASKHQQWKDLGYDSFKADLWGSEPEQATVPETNPIQEQPLTYMEKYLIDKGYVTNGNEQPEASQPKSINPFEGRSITPEELSFGKSSLTGLKSKTIVSDPLTINPIDVFKEDSITSGVASAKQDNTSDYYGQAQSQVGGAQINSNIPEESLIFSTPEEEKADLAKNIIEKSQRQKNAVTGEGNNFGVTDALRDRNFWTLGSSDMSSMIYLKKIANKLEDGSPLTDSDKLLLEAWNTSEQTNQQYPASDANIWYKTGKNITDMIPWLVQFGATRGAGTTVRKGIETTLRTNAEKYLGSTIAKGLSKGLAETAGAYAAASLMPNTHADIIKRTLGDTYKDELGNVQFDGDSADSNVQAIYKGWTNGMLEVLTERLGEGLGGILVTKWPKSKLVKFVAGEGGTNATTNLSKFTKSVGWDGAPMEYFEEFVNTPLNALLVGDSKYSDVIDGKQQLETLMTVVVMGQAMKAVNTVQNKAASIQANRDYKSAKSLFNSEIDQDVRTLIDDVLGSDGSIEEQSAAIHDLLLTLDGEKAGIVLNYVIQNERRNQSNNPQSAQPTGQLPDSPQLPTVNPRQEVEATFRGMGEDLAHKETGTITKANYVTNGREKNIPMYVIQSDETGGMLLRDDKGNQEWAKGDGIAGDPIELSVDDFVAQKMAEYDQGEQAKELMNQNKMIFNNRLVKRSANPSENKTDNSEFWFDDQTDQEVEVPNQVVQEWEKRKAGTPEVTPNIVKTTYGKTNVTGVKNQDGSLSVSEPATIDQANSLKEEVEKATGGSATVQADLIPNEDYTAPRTFQLTIIPKVNEPINNETVTDVPVQDNGLKAEPTDQLFSNETAPAEKKITTQPIGKDQIDFIENEEFDEVVPTDKMPLEKALPILEKKFKDHPKVVVIAEKVQVEVPGKVTKGETKWDDDIVEPSTTKTVIKSIKIVPKAVIEKQKQADTAVLLDALDEFNATPQSRSDKQKGSEIEAIAKQLGYQTERSAMNEIRLFDNSGTISKPKVSKNANIENQNDENVPSITDQLFENKPTVTNTPETNQNINQQNEKPVENITQTDGQINQLQGEDTPQAEQGQGNEKGLEENVNENNIQQAENPPVTISQTVDSPAEVWMNKPNEISGAFPKSEVQVPVFHGSRVQYDEFDESLIGKNDEGVFGKGIYLSENKSNASQYGGADYANVKAFEVDIQKPYIVNFNDTKSVQDARKLLSGKQISAEYDGVIVYENGKMNEVVVRSKSQIKRITTDEDIWKAYDEGRYNQAIKDGKLTEEQAKEIVESSGIKYKKPVVKKSFTTEPVVKKSLSTERSPKQKSKNTNSITGKAKEVEVAESDIQGLALQYFVNGGMVHPDEILRMFRDDKTERDFRRSYTSNEEGLTVAQIAHNIWQTLPENIQDGLGEMDVYNEVESVIRSYNTPTVMAHELLNKYVIDPNQGYSIEWLNNQIRIEAEERQTELDIWVGELEQLEINGKLPTESERNELFLTENTEENGKEPESEGSIDSHRPVNPEGNVTDREKLQGSEPGVQGEIESETSPEVSPVIPQSENKEPWQMTKDEFDNLKEEDYFDLLEKYRLDDPKIFDNTFGARWSKQRRIITKALSEGKPVPQEVLNDYPELQPKKPLSDILSDGKKEVQEKKANQKNDNFVKNNKDGQADQAGLDNTTTMEYKAISSMVGGQQEAIGIYRTIEASNTSGSAIPILTTEELEELESRGINPFWDKPTFLKELKNQALQNGVWLDQSFLGDKILQHDQKVEGTSENDVYLNADGETLTKINNLSYVKSSDHSQNLNATIDRLAAHNALFPQIAYKIKGFVDNKNGYPSLVLEQPFIKDVERNATKEEIEQYLTNRGFKLSGIRDWSNGHEVWSDGKYELFDARPANVLKGNDGQLYFIDAFPHSVEYLQSEKKQSAPLPEEKPSTPEVKKPLSDVLQDAKEIVEEKKLVKNEEGNEAPMFAGKGIENSNSPLGLDKAAPVIEHLENNSTFASEIQYKTIDEFLDDLGNRLTEEQKQDYRDTNFSALSYNNDIVFNSEATQSVDDVLLNWAHEKSHLQIFRNFNNDVQKKKKYFTELYNRVGKSEIRRVIPKSYFKDDIDIQGEEYLVHLAATYATTGKISNQVKPEIRKEVENLINSFTTLKNIQDAKQSQSGTEIESGNEGRNQDARSGNRTGIQPGIGDNGREGLQSDNSLPSFAKGEKGQVKSLTLSDYLAEAKSKVSEKKNTPVEFNSPEVKIYLHNLVSNAVNAGTIHIVESVDQVPAQFMQRVVENKAYGFFDPDSGETYFVTGNIRNLDEAFKAWVHEVGTHKGLRNIIPEELLTPLFERIVDDLGENEINGVLPANYQNESKAVKGEEYLSFLAEKVIKQEDLTPTEKSLWEKILDQVKSLLNKVFNLNEKFTAKDAEELVKAAVQSIYQNRDQANVVNHDGSNDALFRKGNEKTIPLLEYLKRAKEYASNKMQNKLLPQKVRTRTDRFMSRFVNGNTAVRILQEKFDLKVPDYANVFFALNQKSSRQMGQKTHFEKKLYNPLLRSIGNITEVLEKKGLTLEEAYEQIKQYMIARHAPERNGWFRSQGKRGNNFSGMTDEQASGIYENFENEIPKELIDQLWKDTRECTERIAQYWVEYGKYTQASLDAVMDRNWQYYVPLRGWEPIANEIELDYEHSEKKSEFAGDEKTEGRESMADDPISYIYQMATSAIMWGEKNKSKRSLYNLIKLNGGRKELFEMAQMNYMTDKLGMITEVVYEPLGTFKDQKGNDKPEHKVFLMNTDNEGNTKKTELGDKSVLEGSGYTFSSSRVANPMSEKPSYLRKQHEVDVYVDGSKFKMILKDPAISNAINGDNYSQAINYKYLPIANITRFMSRAVTSWRPSFITSNTYRDFKTGAKTMFIQRGLKESLKFQAKYTVAARVLASNMLNDTWRNSSKTGDRMLDVINAEPKTEESRQWKKWYEEYNLNGGPTGHAYLMPLDEVKSKVGKYINKIKRSRSNKLLSLANPLNALKLMEGLSGYGESIARFTAYAMARERGESIIRSINEAKEITTNFDSKGEYAATIGSFIMFFNASTQGAAKQYDLAKNHPFRYFAINAVSLVAQGIMSRYLWDLFNGDDEDKDYAEINKYTMYNNTVLGWKDNYVSIPLAQGYRVWNALGVALYEHQMGRLSTEQMAFDMTEVFSQALSPVEISGIFNKENRLSAPKTAGVLFSAIKPLMDVSINEDFRKKPIYREPFLMSQQGKYADSQMHFNNTNAMIVSFTDWLYKQGGGNPELGTKTIGGKRILERYDWNPAKIEYILKAYSGGPGQTVLDGMNYLILKTVDDLDKRIKDNEHKIEGFDPTSIPILQTYYHKKYTGFMYNEYREIANKAEVLKFEEQRRNQTNDPDKIPEITDDQKDFLMEYDMTDDEIRDLLDSKKTATDEDEKKAIDLQILGLRRGLVSKYKYFGKSK